MHGDCCYQNQSHRLSSASVYTWWHRPASALAATSLSHFNKDIRESLSDAHEGLLIFLIGVKKRYMEGKWGIWHIPWTMCYIFKDKPIWRAMVCVNRQTLWELWQQCDSHLHRTQPLSLGWSQFGCGFCGNQRSSACFFSSSSSGSELCVKRRADCKR